MRKCHKLALTNSSGRKLIESFKIMNTNWHISDHKPICLNVNMDTCPSTHVILARAEDRNSEYDPEQMLIRRCFNQSAFLDSLCVRCDVNHKLFNQSTLICSI